MPIRSTVSRIVMSNLRKLTNLPTFSRVWLDREDVTKLYTEGAKVSSYWSC